MSASPAVILANIPSFLRSNGKTTAVHVLGSKTGVEVGACYWKLHPTMPRFMVVFKNRVDRDNWHNNSMKLKEMKQNGVLVSTAWYSRDMDEVLGEEEGQALGNCGRGKKEGGGNYMKLLHERDRIDRTGAAARKIPSLVGGDFKKANLSVDNMSALSAEIEDLDKLATSQFIFAQKNKLENLVNLPFPLLPRNSSSIPPRKTPSLQVSQPVITTRSYNLRSSHIVTSKPPPLLNISQDFSVPPPPLRLPLHVKPAKAVADDTKTDVLKDKFNSNILTKLEDAVFESLENDKENKNSGDIKRISKTVAKSWKPNIEHLEKIYEAVLSELSFDVSKLTEDLARNYTWEGGDGVTRDQVLGLTEEFLVKAGMKAGSDMEEMFTRFLVKNGKRFKISIDEIKFIMQRNGLDINSICKVFSKNSSSVGFKNFIKNSVSISGQLLDDFSGVFLDFFKSKMDQENNRSCRNLSQMKQSDGRLKALADTGTRMNAKGDTEAHGDKIKELLANNNVKGIKQCVNENASKMKKLTSRNQELEEKSNELINERNKLAAEMKVAKDDFHEKIRAANQENKMLRARNTSLQDDVRNVKEEKEKSKMVKISKFVNKFNESVCRADTDIRQLFDVSLDEKDDEVGKLKEALRSLVKIPKFGVESFNTEVDADNQEMKGTRGNMVKLVMSEGHLDYGNYSTRNMEVVTNQENLMSMETVEMVGKKVTGIKYRQGKGKGWRNLKVEEGMVHPPAAGWGYREYVVVTQDEASGHLGQGCVSTPGHSRRQGSNGGVGPMFPPHVVGPRILTE